MFEIWGNTKTRIELRDVGHYRDFDLETVEGLFDSWNMTVLELFWNEMTLYQVVMLGRGLDLRQLLSSRNFQ